MPSLKRIDHIHVYAPDRQAAERWYAKVLDFQRAPEFAAWFTDKGPLVIINGGVHLALFESPGLNNTTIAFAVDAANYLQWKQRLSEHGVAFRESDHELSWSIYFSDPYGNPYEITCYDYNEVTSSNG